MTVLAEKLAERKDLVALIGRLDDEIAAALIFEDDGTEQTTINKAEAGAEVARLDGQLVAALNELERLENLIRGANTRHQVEFDGDTYTISEAVVLRDRLKTEHNARKTIADATDPTGRSSRRSYGYGLERRKKDEIELRSVKDGRTARDEADAVARRLRLLDAAIQRVNWTAEV